MQIQYSIKHFQYSMTIHSMPFSTFNTINSIFNTLFNVQYAMHIQYSIPQIQYSIPYSMFNMPYSIFKYHKFNIQYLIQCLIDYSIFNGSFEFSTPSAPIRSMSQKTHYCGLHFSPSFQSPETRWRLTCQSY